MVWGLPLLHSLDDHLHAPFLLPVMVCCPFLLVTLLPHNVPFTIEISCRPRFILSWISESSSHTTLYSLSYWPRR
jgi:hypothetical protein